MKLSSLRKLPQDNEAVWIPFNPDDPDGFQLLMKPLDNPSHAAAMTKMAARLLQLKTTKRGRRKGKTELSAEELTDVMIKTIPDHCILDWKELEGDDGENIPYSQSTCLSMLVDTAYADFRREVLMIFRHELSRDDEQAEAKTIEEATGN